MTAARSTASTITDDQLDALYAQRDAFAAAVAAVSVKAHQWAELAPPDDWGLTPGDTTLADAGRYLIALMVPTAPLPPAEPSAPPMPRRTPPGPPGDDAARFPAPASRQGAGRSEAPTRNGPQNAPGGVSRVLGAPGGPVPASSPGATTTATSQRIDQETQR